MQQPPVDITAHPKGQERQKRTGAHERRPLGLIFIAIGYLLAPVGNALLMSGERQLSPSLVLRNAVALVGPLGVALAVLSPLVGLGIYTARRWGYYLFFAHAIADIGNNAWRWFIAKQSWTEVFLNLDFALIVAVLYMITEDLRAPYLASDKRGWRQAQRFDCELPIALLTSNRDLPAVLKSVSANGARVSCPQAGALHASEAIVIVAPIEGSTLTLDASVLRVDGEIAAIEFASRPKGRKFWKLVRAHVLRDSRKG